MKDITIRLLAILSEKCTGLLSNVNIMAVWLPSCHVEQRGNRIAIGRKTGVIVIDYDYPKLIHTIVIVIVIE